VRDNGNGFWKFSATLLAGLLGGLVPAIFLAIQKPSETKVKEMLLAERELTNARMETAAANVETLKIQSAKMETAIERARAELLAEIRKERP